MAYYGVAAADSTDTPRFHIENDSLGIRCANIDANEVHDVLTCFHVKCVVRHLHWHLGERELPGLVS